MVHLPFLISNLQIIVLLFHFFIHILSYILTFLKLLYSRSFQKMLQWKWLKTIFYTEQTITRLKWINYPLFVSRLGQLDTRCLLHNCNVKQSASFHLTDVQLAYWATVGFPNSYDVIIMKKIQGKCRGSGVKHSPHQRSRQWMQGINKWDDESKMDKCLKITFCEYNLKSFSLL